MRFSRFFSVIPCFVILALFSCSSSNVILAGKEFHSFSQIDFESVRFRRPEGALFDPEESKRAKIDAAGNKLPDHPKELGNLDCEKSEAFFGRLNLAGISACLGSLGKKTKDKDPLEVEWKLNKESQPSLKLRNPEDAPACFREFLSEIPFPRELVFVAQNDEEEGACYTSRLALESGELLGWELPKSRVRLRVKFPLVKPPGTSGEVERLLRSWVLSIFRGAGAEDQRFHGRFLPTRYCLRCLGLPEATEEGPGRVPPLVRPWPVLDDGGKQSLR